MGGYTAATFRRDVYIDALAATLAGLIAHLLRERGGKGGEYHVVNMTTKCCRTQTHVRARAHANTNTRAHTGLVNQRTGSLFAAPAPPSLSSLPLLPPSPPSESLPLLPLTPSFLSSIPFIAPTLPPLICPPPHALAHTHRHTIASTGLQSLPFALSVNSLPESAAYI